MSETAIRTIQLGKHYRTKHGEQSVLLRDKLFNDALEIVGLRRNKTHSVKFWALRNISTEIKKGSITGILGSNGSGKTTFLRLLSHITQPSEGQMGITGKVCTLIGEHAGFHPELTGEENIYLHGAVLGMPRSEIENQFDKIIDFSGVEEWLFMPIKHYSTGMKARLSFAIAAHLDADILLLDEVLAKADVEFQRHCHQKIIALADEGKTILYVHHDNHTLGELCTDGLLFSKGSLVYSGTITETLKHVDKFENPTNISAQFEPDKK